METRNLVPELDQAPVTSKKAAAKPKRKSFVPEDQAQLLRGIFLFHETPGGVLNFPAKAFKGQQVEFFSLEDNKEYELPRWVVQHINSSVRYPIYQELPKESGFQQGVIASRFGGRVQPMRARKWVPRASFQPIDFYGNKSVKSNQEEIEIVEE